MEATTTVTTPQQQQQLPFRRRNMGNCGDRIKTTIIGRQALSPRSVCDIPALDHLLQPSYSSADDENHHHHSHHDQERHTTTLFVVGGKRKFPFDSSFRVLPSTGSTTALSSSCSIPPPTMHNNTVNLRHRLVCDEMVDWLAAASSSSTSSQQQQLHPPVEKLWLGPVFDSPETVLSAIATLPETVTHLDLDLRNALHLVPRAMPLLFDKQHVKTLSVRLFGDAGAVDLAQWLHRHTNLEQLDLRGNRIGSLGARTIVDAMIACKHQLQHLNLSCNCILHGDLIGQLLAFSTKLHSLDLGYNWLGDEEVADICQGLRKNTSLRELNLVGCTRISHEGFHALLDCIQHHNTSLHKVQLQAVDEEGRRLIKEINYWLSLNKAGRYLIKSETPVAEGLWSRVLSKSSNDPDSLFYLVREAIGPAKTDHKKKGTDRK